MFIMEISVVYTGVDFNYSVKIAKKYMMSLIKEMILK